MGSTEAGAEATEGARSEMPFLGPLGTYEQDPADSLPDLTAIEDFSKDPEIAALIEEAHPRNLPRGEPATLKDALSRGGKHAKAAILLTAIGDALNAYSVARRRRGEYGARHYPQPLTPLLLSGLTEAEQRRRDREYEQATEEVHRGGVIAGAKLGLTIQSKLAKQRAEGARATRTEGRIYSESREAAARAAEEAARLRTEGRQEVRRRIEAGEARGERRSAEQRSIQAGLLEDLSNLGISGAEGMSVEELRTSKATAKAAAMAEKAADASPSDRTFYAQAIDEGGRMKAALGAGEVTPEMIIASVRANANAMPDVLAEEYLQYIQTVLGIPNIRKLIGRERSAPQGIPSHGPPRLR